jgi:hypothetical protein
METAEIRKLLTQAAVPVLDQAASDDVHGVCELPPASREHRLAHSPGKPPLGYARKLAACVRSLGYTISMHDEEELRQYVWNCGNLEAGFIQGVTTGWSRVSPFTVKLLKGQSGMSLVSTLAHEAGHIILRHNPSTSWEAERWHRGEDPRAELACELGAAILMDTTGTGVAERSLNYIGHQLEAVSMDVVSDAVHSAATMYPWITGTVRITTPAYL